ncbi:RNA-binding domain-containing protein [uncultured Subdoligranulum sp.]|uniref:RNA-binding domain-containing protein n=1 Tax=uncultured Subdoligranulum sp. TaxID=512298 RepID=UPI002638A6F2|nr:RNA-binding domain-containing protein [uncultured Subdoligranulum sp.]
MMEGKTTEFKREYVDDIRYTVVAFANTDGGKIYIGINDDGSVQGIDNVDDVQLRITNMIRDSIRPDVTMFTECSVELIQGKMVVVLTVQRGTARPYYLAGKGIRPEGVYLRQGASSVPASETAILNMIKETSGDCYEDARSLNQQLTFCKAEDYFARHNVPFGESQKRTLGIIGEDGMYTNLGLLLSDQCVHTMKLAVFEGSKKTIFRDRKELSGSLLAQLEEAYEYISQFNHTRAEFSGLDRIDKRNYPEEAVREALLNAITHRDYGFSGPTLISIFDDRIEFVTIGGLVRGLTFDDIMLGVSVLRNKKLANVFYRLKLIEAYGTGILRINECYADCEAKPRFEVTDNAFKITLPNTNFSGEVEEKKPVAQSKAVSKKDRQVAVLQLAKKQGTIVRKEVEAALQVSQATAILILREMVDKGVLVKEGTGKHMRYRVAQNPNEKH